MPRFRRKPTETEAEQFTHPATAPRGVYVGENGECWVVTIHGHKTPVVPGDWIMPEPDGEHFYPIKDDVFRATWDPIPEQHEVYSRPECLFNYCPSEGICKAENRCQHQVKV
jgi:hypothetical protein